MKTKIDEQYIGFVFQYGTSGPVFCSLGVLVRDHTSLCLPKIIGQGEILRFHSLRDCVLFPWRPSKNNLEYLTIIPQARMSYESIAHEAKGLMASESIAHEAFGLMGYLTIIPQALMGYESIAHEAEGRMGY